MKNRILSLLLLVSGMAIAQPGDDDIEYFTDSKVKHSRFSAALILNPNYTDRRIINDELPPSGGGYDLIDTKAKGSFQLNYNAEFFYAIGGSFKVGMGFGRAAASYEVDEIRYYDNRPNNDTVKASLAVDVSMFTVPIKLNFNTRVSDLWSLEVVPALELNFVDKYNQVVTPVGESAISSDLSSRVQSLNYTVNLSLGGTYHLSEAWGIVVRGKGGYMLNAIIEEVDFPRETTFNFGVNLGLSYQF